MTFKKIQIAFCLLFATFGTLEAQSVDAILEKYYAAIGGEEQVRKLTSSVITEREYTSFQLGLLPELTFSTRKEIKNLYPYYSTIRAVSPQEFLSRESERLKINNRQGYYNIEIKPETYSTKSAPREYCAVHPALHLKLLHEKGQLTAGKDTTVFNQKCWIIRAHNNSLSYYFRKSDGLLSIVASSLGFSTFTDYRMVAGVRYPFKQQYFSKKNEDLSWIEVDKVEFNVDLKPADFDVDESKLSGLHVVKFLPSKIEYLQHDVKDLAFSEMIRKHFAGKRVLIYPWASWCDACKFEFLNYDGLFYSFMSDQKITLMFLSIDDEGNQTQWKQDVSKFNLYGYHLLAPPASALYNNIKDLFYKDRQLDSPMYILVDENGAILSQRIKKSSDNQFKSQLRELLGDK